MSSTTKLAVILLALILSFLLGALVVQVAYSAPEDGVYPPPGTRVVVMPCAAAGYPAGWGPGCTVHRLVPASTRSLRRYLPR